MKPTILLCLFVTIFQQIGTIVTDASSSRSASASATAASKTSVSASPKSPSVTSNTTPAEPTTTTMRIKIFEHLKNSIDAFINANKNTFKFEVIPKWKEDKTDVFCDYKTPLYANTYLLCYTQYEDKKEIVRNMNIYGSQKACNPHFCGHFKDVLTKLNGDNKCEDADKFWVDRNEKNTKCLSIEDVDDPTNTYDFCVCVFKNREEVYKASYVVYESLTNRGIFNYFRLKDKSYQIVKQLRDSEEITMQHLMRITKHRVKMYPLQFTQVFRMVHQTTSDCQTGIFKFISTSENWKQTPPSLKSISEQIYEASTTMSKTIGKSPQLTTRSPSMKLMETLEEEDFSCPDCAQISLESEPQKEKRKSNKSNRKGKGILIE